MERTLIIAKPDALQRGLVGEIIKRLERKGLKLIGIKMMTIDSALLQAHYAHLTDKPFYADLEDFMRSSPVIAMAWEGYQCINSVRIIVGATNPREAVAGSIRGDFSIGTGRNLVHASTEDGDLEVSRFFKEDELHAYDKSEYLYVYSDSERD